jgi:hypothetical protein
MISETASDDGAAALPSDVPRYIRQALVGGSRVAEPRHLPTGWLSRLLGKRGRDGRGHLIVGETATAFNRCIKGLSQSHEFGFAFLDQA